MTAPVPARSRRTWEKSGACYYCDLLLGEAPHMCRDTLLGPRRLLLLLLLLHPSLLLPERVKVGRGPTAGRGGERRPCLAWAAEVVWAA